MRVQPFNVEAGGQSRLDQFHDQIGFIRSEELTSPQRAERDEPDHQHFNDPNREANFLALLKAQTREISRFLHGQLMDIMLPHL